MNAVVLSVCAFVAVVSASASPDYSISMQSFDGSGNACSSAQYTLDGSVIGAISNAVGASANYADKTGYSGQQPNPTAITLVLVPATISESAARQLGASETLDDATVTNLIPANVAWNIASGPIVSVTTGGLATAATVYQDTAAAIGGSANGLNATLNLTVINTNIDDYGSYAGDGIDDAWQVQYFGINNPNAGPTVDFDGTGQNNLFKYIAGLNPLDGSRFTLAIAVVPGQPGQKDLIFKPIVAGRTYTVQSVTDLVPTPLNWAALTSSSQSDTGTTRTVRDLNAAGTRKFYHVQITKP